MLTKPSSYCKTAVKLLREKCYLDLDYRKLGRIGTILKKFYLYLKVKKLLVANFIFAIPLSKAYIFQLSRMTKRPSFSH